MPSLTVPGPDRRQRTQCLRPPMTTISPTTSQISPATERVYHQSNLLGDWKGTWANTSRPVEFKVINIRGDKAQIEYTHDGHTERGLADVNGATITFGNVTIGTRNGSVAAFEFSVGGAKKTATLNKQAADRRSEQAGRHLERLFDQQRQERELHGQVGRRPRRCGELDRRRRRACRAPAPSTRTP